MKERDEWPRPTRPTGVYNHVEDFLRFSLDDGRQNTYGPTIGGNVTVMEIGTHSSRPPNVTVGLDNITEIVADEDMPLAEKILSAVFLFLFIIITVIGNILVIMSVFTYRPLRNVQNFFIVSLAAADMAVALLVMPFNIINFIMGHWIFGAIFCDMWLTFDVLCCTASILNLCAIATDRYWAIHDPLNYASKRTMKRVLLLIALVWGSSAVISIPPLIGWNNWEDRMEQLEKHHYLTCELTSERGYVIYSASGSFYIPLMIMTFVYLKIFLATRRRLRQRKKRTQALNVGQNNTTTNTRAVTTTVNTNATGTTTVVADISSTETPDEMPMDETNHVGENDKQREEGKEKEKEKKEHKHRSKNRTSTESKQPLTQNSKRTKSIMHQFLEEKQKISLSKERRAARTLGIIMGVFMVCWIPFFIMYVVMPFCPTCKRPNPRFENFIVWLGYVNSGLNPVIYTVFNIDFRKAFKKLLTGKSRR
ncbi:probable G-protein coupled receptor No18 [Lineus longissimus]|uniref:probable G-protein coupled receptor No18 n=1 Tax=Lineus longissimus TaxID=88925 RepID=UPI002B4CDA38